VKVIPETRLRGLNLISIYYSVVYVTHILIGQGLIFAVINCAVDAKLCSCLCNAFSYLMASNIHDLYHLRLYAYGRNLSGQLEI